MITWTRQKQEKENQKYFFNGKVLITETVSKKLTLEEIASILADIREFASQNDGCDCTQRFIGENGEIIWVIDQLDKYMIESGKFSPEDNFCTILFPYVHYPIM